MKKILFVQPSTYDAENRLVKSRKSYMPSRILPYLAGLTPARFEPLLIDEFIDDVPFNADVDLVALTGLLHNVPRAIHIAEEFRMRGKKVIIGGPGAFSIFESIRKMNVFDAIVLGEAEELWDVVLTDCENERLEPVYRCSNPPDLVGLPPARFDLLNLKKYVSNPVDRSLPILTIETSRGCPYNCRFCLVTRYFGRKMRYRPIGEVLDDIKKTGARFIMFTDDNIAVDHARAEELFHAVKKLGIVWIAQFDSQAVRNPRLLRLAADAGCLHAFVGLESVVDENLDALGKRTRIDQSYSEVTDGFREAGIHLLASLIFGCDHDTPETIEATLRWIHESNAGVVVPWILTPLPGTPLYEKFRNENRLLHENYSLYDCWHAVIKPVNMTPAQLEHVFWKGLDMFYSRRNIARRLWWGMKGGQRHVLAMAVVNLTYRAQTRRHIHPYAARY